MVYDEQNKNNRHPKCHLVHHWNPFLIIGPFHIEVSLYQPFRTIMHDFYTENEMNCILDFSSLRLRKSREDQIYKVTPQSETSPLVHNKTAVTEAVAFWLNDIEYPEKEIYTLISKEGQPREYTVSPAVKDPYKYIVSHKLLYTICLLYTSPSPRDVEESRMPSSA